MRTQRHTNCEVCGRFVPDRNIITCGGGWTGEPLELVEALCDKCSNRVPSSVAPASGPGGDRPTPTGQVTPNHNGDEQ